MKSSTIAQAMEYMLIMGLAPLVILRLPGKHKQNEFQKVLTHIARHYGEMKKDICALEMLTQPPTPRAEYEWRSTKQLAENDAERALCEKAYSTGDGRHGFELWSWDGVNQPELIREKIKTKDEESVDAAKQIAVDLGLNKNKIHVVSRHTIESAVQDTSSHGSAIASSNEGASGVVVGLTADRVVVVTKYDTLIYERDTLDCIPSKGDVVTIVIKNGECAVSKTGHDLAFVWNATPATGAQSGNIVDVSDTEVIQHTGRDGYVVWKKENLVGDEIEIGKQFDIEADGSVKSYRSGPGVSL